MKDSVLGKYADRIDSVEADLSLEDDLGDDVGSFGWLRGVRERAVMLELRKRNGNVLAISYGWLEKIEFDPSKGIVLHVGTQRIMIAGRNLNAEARPQIRLFNGLCRHRIAWVQEADQVAKMGTPPDKTLIEEIRW